jgi:hypothetical protein
MSIDAMKQALEALENARIAYDFHGNPDTPEDAAIAPAVDTLRLAIEQAEQQEPVCDKDPQGCWNVRRLHAVNAQLLEALKRIEAKCSAPPDFSDATMQEIARAAIAAAK